MIKLELLSNLFTKRDDLLKNIQDLEQTLKSLRNFPKHTNSDWEMHIETDPRKSVQILYRSLIQLRNELDDLCNSWAGVMTIEDAKCLSIGRSVSVDSSKFKSLEDKSL